MSSIYSKKINKCRVCFSELQEIINLGKQPPANTLSKNREIKVKEINLKLMRCINCKTLQLSESVSKKYLFNNYVWVTGTSKAAKIFSQKFYNLVSTKLKDKSRYVLEIASNDGTFLLPFKKNKYSIIGIDPAKNICELANNNKIKTINEFFNASTAKKIFKKYNYANFIFARNVIPHVENINDVIKGISLLMDNKTIGCIEFHYVAKIIKENQYDSIYHEHIFYFSIQSIIFLLKKFFLYSFDIEVSPISGGSLIIFFSKLKTKKTKKLIDKINIENRNKYNSLDKINKFSINCINHRNKFKSLISKSQKKYKNIYGYGASARSSTLLNFSNISGEIKGIFDKNPIKINSFTAGSKILIEDIKNFNKIKPDLVVILAWNFKNEIINELDNIYKYNGDYLIPIPVPKILKYENRKKIR